MRSSLAVVLIVAATALGAAPALSKDPSIIVGTKSGADGSSQINSEVIEECVLQLPTVAQLEPVTDAKAEYLRGIGGDLNKNENVQTYSARIDLTYVVRQKRLVVVTTNSVERSEPVFKEVDGRFDKVMHFESNSDNGNAWAGRDPLKKTYYFSTPEAAIADVKKRAEAWLSEKKAVMCSEGQ